MPSSEELLRNIERAYVKGVASKPGLISCGPFLISLNPSSKLVWLNNAVVADETAVIGGPDVEAMMKVFVNQDRTPRMELFKELWPDLIGLLQLKGFEIESETPVMVCTRESFTPRLDSRVQVRRLTAESDPVPFLKVVDSAFGHPDPIGPDRIERTRSSLRRGSMWSALATIGGSPAAGASLIPSDGTAELAGVGTADKFRRRGAASAASSVLLQDFFADGDLAWLSAGDDAAKAVYERLGFSVIGTQVNISIPGDR